MELTMDHIFTSLTTQGHGGPPRLGVSSMPGPPTRQYEHERRYTPVTHPSIQTTRIWTDDYEDEMIFGNLVGLKFPDTCLIGEEKPHPGNLSRPGIEPEPLRDRPACYRLLHSDRQVSISSECSAQGQVFYCKRRNKGWSCIQRQVFYFKLKNQGCSFSRDE